MSNQPRTIGIHAARWLDHTRRLINGVLRYVEDRPALRIRDFQFPRNDPKLVGNPPWTGKVDGIVIGASRDPGIEAWLRRGGVPVVVTGSDLADSRFVSVFTDVRSVARLAADHLLEGGYRDVAFVGYRNSDGSRRRKKALADELARRGLKLRTHNTRTVLTGTYEDLENPEAVTDKLVALLENSSKPLGILALNDNYAVTLLRLAEKLNLSVPDEVGVLGVDDTDAARISDPSISSIRTPGGEIGYRAAALLHEIMKGRKPAETVVEIPAVELVARQSTAGWQRAAVTDIERARAYIRDHACEGIRLRDVAMAVRVPVRTLEIDFKAGVGRSIGEEIREVRFARAKELVETTNLSIRRIAALAGYSHDSYLTKLFRDQLGMTPSEYRRKHR